MQIARDLENAETAAGSEWDEVKGKALLCNILCWALPLFGACCYCHEAKQSPTAQYVHDIQTMDRFKALVEDIRKAQPVLRLNICCWHTESRTDSEGNTSTHTVVTKTASEDISGFAAVLDETLSADDMWALVAETHRPVVEGEILLVQVHINALPVSEHSLEQLRVRALNWFNVQQSDVNQDYSWSWELDTSGFQTLWPSGGRLTLAPGSSKPEWLSQEEFERSVTLGCAYCYRKKLFESARKIDFHVNKHFQMPGTPAVGPEAVPFSVRKGVPKMAQYLPPAPTPVWCPDVGAGGVPLSAVPFGAQQTAPLQQNSMGAHNLTVGVTVEVLSPKGAWRVANVCGVNEATGEVQIHYEGFASQYDEWIHMSSSRIRSPTQQQQSSMDAVPLGAQQVAPSQPQQAAHCPACGTANVSGAKFCHECGQMWPDPA